MDEATRGRMFEPFFTTKEIGRGTGLGLSVVYGVVNNHRGYIEVESELQQGTSFHLYLPLQPRTIVAAPAPAQPAQTATAGTETILVVEDEEMLLMLLQGILEDNGYRVLTAADGQQGLEVYAEHQTEIDLVVTDMGLPRLGGWEMFAKMKGINPNVKAILASGYCDPKIKAEMVAEGAKDFIQKPYVSESVLRRIREILDEGAQAPSR
jgi:CheY-like chemotaxis protein